MTSSQQEPSRAALEWQDGQPFSVVFGDVYFSRDAGLDETRHVFLRHNQLQERFAALPEDGGFCIAETGFGTGLNFLCAWQLFDAHAPAGARLHFVSAEKFPLSPDDLRQALNLWPELQPWSAPLLAQYGEMTPGWHRLPLAGGRATLTLMIGDVLDVLPQLDARVDAWFLDGFAPAKNPDMWQQSLFDQMARLSAPGASFATFTSAGIVRRGLAAAGFEVKKAPGHGQKRHISQGWLREPPKQDWQAPWYARPNAQWPERSAIVIGGGLAGAASAHSLAQRGWQVTLLEKLPALAGAASGNPQGVLYTKLSPHLTPLTRLVLSGYAYSLRLLQDKLPVGEDWDDCGVLQLPQDQKEADKQSALAALGLGEKVMRELGQPQAEAIAGLPLPSGGLFFEQGGWVHPPALVAALAAHPNIAIQTHREALSLRYDEASRLWTAGSSETDLASAAVVVLAGAAETRQFEAARHLPLKAIRGQISAMAATETSSRLRAVVCGESYISPARNGSHCLGATFKFDTDDLSVKDEEHAENLQMLAKLAPALHQSLAGDGQAPIGGRAAFRCTSPDYMPLVGPLVDARRFVQTYREMARDATNRPEADSPWLPGLFVNVAHGSRGLITAPLAGEVLAAYLENEPAPLPLDLMQAVHPSRFLLRDLIRRKLDPDAV
ncbi:bifunctional tRNA (5-methylaminomethyl-2-thiouridine)(34)-methyltransferase MnmD/FAD-dependent 5-carboxymethylaminomethyl-2-thiouridine(34) oxidoreductase MnmC [Chromobacterium sp. IIBBL 290-4]|uniref:bifunctional tRNA (5-methylaminomethyl-2-thiouridine)(34)-methyltransferase MnmD/FAD-dependent 5-carboxymethylaminomethyl-2-thiouridine(34) oxidoreductase MnmC n=1 Tax=Chromobacterium sp. IIBBL 290-4 TaxID=2953890 RepID=UPI0020B7A7B5|nr:bifunctional tRNA (5-methylaminomethyl-2-thiouridine)(34)-methyltransferase MnmD/FAD-dependent 5-carboxymethylaminomethyl-2-thiouridine(34) oxidoreductase MnmC [Chromobacterium sp. IIBBL 290-4]UTH74085.1 bifunctional tRNA (5-methylaminomethyl-2-thiouridine)(34)-methyltransferase MnmD/FAD-dependent 5-carboxymethylaminomethyl-2-thiouridine(34) oxidoreductase MnmC [Chromobacterium sp. IIBBL 290-4]